MPRYGTFFPASRREQLHERLPEGNFKRTRPPSRLWAPRRLAQGQVLEFSDRRAARIGTAPASSLGCTVSETGEAPKIKYNNGDEAPCNRLLSQPFLGLRSQEVTLCFNRPPRLPAITWAGGICAAALFSGCFSTCDSPTLKISPDKSLRRRQSSVSHSLPAQG
jgi:hypothetical protein